jgi:hypothetical protein
LTIALAAIADSSERDKAERAALHRCGGALSPGPNPGRGICARCSLTATWASASSPGARTSASKLATISTATAMYRDMDMTYWLEKAEVEIDQLPS